MCGRDYAQGHTLTRTDDSVQYRTLPRYVIGHTLVHTDDGVQRTLELSHFRIDTLHFFITF